MLERYLLPTVKQLQSCELLKSVEGETAPRKIAKKLVEIMYRNSLSDGKTPPSFGVYITSFCRVDNDNNEAKHGRLSQWRAYGRGQDGGGYAIVFDAQKLSSLMKEEAEKGVVLFCRNVQLKRST